MKNAALSQVSYGKEIRVSEVSKEGVFEAQNHHPVFPRDMMLTVFSMVIKIKDCLRMQMGHFKSSTPVTSAPYPGTTGMDLKRSYKCEICGKRYMNLNGLKYHQ